MLLATLTSCGEPGTGAAERLSGVLITLDTTNASALGVYSQRAGITPNLDALATESLVYTNARTVAPLTLPAHSSMLTGLYPIRHTVRDNGLTALPASAGTLAEAAEQNGYQTAAFIAAVVLSAPYGLNQGFETYADTAGTRGHDRPASVITQSAIDWLDARDRERPFFLWVHYFDAHSPYEPAPRYVKQVQSHTQSRFPNYLGAVAQIDDSLGELLNKLQDEGLFETSLVAVVADHGEALYRHKEPTHSMLVYDTTIRVPFFLRHPDHYRAGQRSDEIVSVTDIFPTFMEAFGLEPPERLDGLSLFKHSVPPDRGVYYESFSGYLSCGWSPLTGWADAEGTYIHSSSPELFAASDAGQTENLLAQDPDRGRVYRRQIARVADQPKLLPSSSKLDAEFRERIKALGYLGGGDPELALPHPFDTAGLQNPRDLIADMDQFQAASRLAGNGKFEEATDLLQKYLEQNVNYLATELLGQMLSAQHRFEEAITVLRTIENSGVPRRYSITMLAEAYEFTNRPKEALDVYLKAHQTWPDALIYIERIVNLFTQLGQSKEAEAYQRLLTPEAAAASKN